jgi:TPR repeat protein
MKSKSICGLICLVACIRVWGQESAKEWYDKGVEYYKNRNYTQAVQCWREAAEQGNAAAQSDLGSCYYRGYGVAKDYVQAAQWWSKAAEQGDAPAQRCLGDCYNTGKGVIENKATAFGWYLKAAAGGDAAGQLQLAVMYESGVEDTLAKDGNTALYLYEKALTSDDLSKMQELQAEERIKILKKAGYSSSRAKKQIVNSE